ncbi:hypothetical protein BHE74_00000904 [Ensete ventricosum]|nr:hypothetical protein BHE74_00000904 [Ensete ventricosum]
MCTLVCCVGSFIVGDLVASKDPDPFNVLANPPLLLFRISYPTVDNRPPRRTLEASPLPLAVLSSSGATQPMSSSSLSPSPGFVFKRANREAMQRLVTSLRPLRHMGMMGSKPSRSTLISSRFKSCAAVLEETELGEFLDYMEKLKNYERVGVPQGAGTDTDDGFDLGRMRRLLQRLGNPHKQFKVCDALVSKPILADLLPRKKTPFPHLLSIRERISVERSGDPVSAGLLKKVFCEVFTALAYLLFSEERVDIAVIESLPTVQAGLGGARDATNVICSTELATSVITSIGEEHLAALGGSLESIAMAKSGIIKHGCPVV